MLTASISVLLGLVLVGPAPKGPREIHAHDSRPPASADEDLSRAGTRRGTLHLTLGAVVGLSAAAVVGRGLWELHTGRQLVADCDNFVTSDVLCDRPDPAQGNKVAAGLSFGLAVPLAVGAALLLVRGSRIRRDYRDHRRQQGAVTWVPGGLAIRF